MIRPGLPGQFHRVLLALCLLLLVQVGPALAGSVRLYWDANTEPDLAGYVLVYGNASGVYTTSVPLPASAVTHEFTDSPGRHLLLRDSRVQHRQRPEWLLERSAGRRDVDT